MVTKDFASLGQVTGESGYSATETPVSNPLIISIKAKFRYRYLNFSETNTTANGLYGVSSDSDAAPIPFAEFRIFDSAGNQIQQGETDTHGIATFKIPKNPGNYTFKIYSRSYNSYVKVSVLEDTYSNQPYSVSKAFSVTAADISAGTKDLTSAPLFAEADETIAPKIEGGAFNIMFNILLANEYLRRQIGKNNDNTGVPVANPQKWWVADKVTVYWKMGFNPRSYFSNDGSMLSFYSPGTAKLYILGGYNGDVKNSDTDHFDDSVILHEYAHFLEDIYGHSESPGGSHNGNFVIDPRLSWSEGWANYFQAAVLSGSANVDAGTAESDVPASGPRFHYYVDTYGYKATASDSNGGIGIAFDLTEQGQGANFDSVTGRPAGEGTFREVSISRTLYKSSRTSTKNYSSAGVKGGGITFANFWRAFAGEDNVIDSNGINHNSSNPLTYSLRNQTKYPIPNAGLFNFLLTKYVGTTSTLWNAIITEEKQTQGTQDYAFYMDTSNSGTCSFSFSGGWMESTMPRDSVPHSNQLKNNDFFLIKHTQGVTDSFTLNYSTTSPNDIDLDLYVYNRNYVYVEDYYLNGGYDPSAQMAGYSRRNFAIDGGATGTGSETVTLKDQPTGFYLINVKINAYNKIQMTSTATYTLKKNGVTLCASEQN
ncbi:MAG: hypothetical protein ACM3MG_06220 [Bacillota bacterium]